MTTTRDVVTDLLRREGGDQLTTYPWDRGGVTKYGITARTLGRFRQLGRHATRAEVAQLDEATARTIYESMYVTPFAAVPEPLHQLVVDWGVTSPHNRVVESMQQSLAARGHDPGPIDGILGSRTKAALQAAPVALIYADVLSDRIAFYLTLGFDDHVRAFLATHPTTQLHNLRGWINRCREFLVLDEGDV